MSGLSQNASGDVIMPYITYNIYIAMSVDPNLFLMQLHNHQVYGVTKIQAARMDSRAVARAQAGKAIPKIRRRPPIPRYTKYDRCQNGLPCPRGSNCTFAHSEEELHHWFRSRMEEEPRLQPPEGARPPYKMCKNVQDTGYCSYDARCNFPHSRKELEAWSPGRY